MTKASPSRQTQPVSRWRTYSRRVIAETVAAWLGQEHRGPGFPVAALSRADALRLLRAVSAAYPFGERRRYPYKIWLSELRRLKVAAGLVARVAGERPPAAPAQPAPGCPLGGAALVLPGLEGGE